MILVAFACFLVLIVAWLLASNIEGEPTKVAAPAPIAIEGTPVAEPA